MIEKISDSEVLNIEEIKEILKKEVDKMEDLSFKVLILRQLDKFANDYRNMLKLEKYVEKREHNLIK